LLARSLSTAIACSFAWAGPMKVGFSAQARGQV
jgi:hypothetical protein